MKNSKIIRLFLVTALGLSIVGCGTTQENLMQTDDAVYDDNLDDVQKEEAEEDNLQVAQASPYVDENVDDHDNDEDLDQESVSDEEEIEEPEEYLPGYDTEAEFKNRHTGSVSLIDEPTVLVSIFVDEEEDVWSAEEKLITLNTAKIAYGFIQDTLKEEYDVNANLIFDWSENPDLIYSTRIYESISPYVETEEERHIEELSLDWVAQVPYRDLMLKYETTSIGFLYFIPHEGMAYSSMHFIEDGDHIWNEGCLLYLQDMDSDTYDYDTPPVYAHELLHLFGAEDYYASADVFSKETYSALKKNCSKDIMFSTFDMVGGVYTTYPDSVPREITPVTAYLLGIGDEGAVEDIPELVREEAGCFPGSTFDRPF